MDTRLFSLSLFGFGFGITLSLGACANPELQAPCAVTPGAPDAQRIAKLSHCMNVMSESVVRTRLKNDLDILFMIDNSGSMSPKQKVLAQNIPTFMRRIEEAGASYHVGVITSDVGSLPLSGAPEPNFSDPRCNTPSGDNGKLQVQHAIQRAIHLEVMNDIPLQEGEARLVRQVGQVGGRPSGEVVEPHHLGPVRQEPVHQMRTEKAGGASDEHSHAVVRPTQR